MGAEVDIFASQGNTSKQGPSLREWLSRVDLVHCNAREKSDNRNFDQLDPSCLHVDLLHVGRQALVALVVALTPAYDVFMGLCQAAPGGQKNVQVPGLVLVYETFGIFSPWHAETYMILVLSLRGKAFDMPPYISYSRHISL